MSPARAAAPVSVPFYSGAARPPGLQLPAPAPQPPPWPNQYTTGYLNAPGYSGSLQNGSSLTIASNTTYSFYSFPAGVVVNSGVHDVTFIGCEFTQSGGVGSMAVYMDNGNANPNFTFSYCTFAPAGIAPYGPSTGVTLAQSYQYAVFCNFNTGKLTVDHCDCWGFGNGAVTANGGSQASPHVFTNNFIHDLCQDNTYHSDGLGQPGGGDSSYDVISHNTINSVGNTQALAYENSPGPSTWDHFTITNNLFGGFGFTVNVINGTPSASTPPTNITFTGNTLTTQFQPIYGPLYDAGISESASGNLWRNNKWYVPPGAQWGHSQYSGYFWMPVVNSHASPTLDELAAGLVSLTDFTG